MNKSIKAQGDHFGSTALSMLRHVVVYWVLYEAVHAAARAMGELGKNMLMIDAAAARASYAMGIGQGQARGLAMDAMITGARYGQGPTEAIGAFQQAARYTRDAATQQTLIQSSAQLAMLTGGDQADAMGDLITLSRQWNLEQSQIPRVLDLTAAALKNTNVDLGDFIDSMAQGSVVGKMMGWTLEQTAGMYAGYLQVSGKTPSQATTIFERIATIGSRPTDLAKLNQLGIATQKINGEMLDASVIIGQLSDKWAGLSKAQQDIAIEAFGGQRLAAEFRSLIDNYPTLVQFQKDFNVKIGEGKDATDKLFNNLEAQAARVLPSVGAAVTAALTPSPEVYAGLTRFFRELSDVAEGAARRNVEPAVRALRDYQKENEQYGSVWKLAGTTQQRQAEQRQKQAERYPEAADFINSPGFKYYADEYAKADDAQKKVIEDLIVEGMKKRRAETLALANQKGTRGPDLPSGYTRPVPGAITQNPEEYERLAKFNIATSRMGRAPNVIETDLTKAQGLAVQQAAEERAKQVTDQLIRQQEIMEGVKFTESERAALAATLRKQYEDQVIYLQVSKNEWLAITGLAAQYAGELAKAKELRPSISVMPEMNTQNFEKYKRYVSQYERVLDQMGVKQTPYQALIFGQGGQVFKSITTQEANTLAMALLTEEIKKNTETQGQLRGHWNIPSAFGYRPPTVWEYYSKTGSTEMGPVNYPWMHEGADKKGKPLIGSVATGITDTYTTTFGNSVNKFDAAVMAFSNVVKPGTSGKESTRAGVGPTDYQDTDDWYLRHRGFVPTAPGVLPHTNRFDRMNDLSTIAGNDMMGWSGLAPGAPVGKAALVAMADRFSAQYGLKDKNVLRAIIQAESQWNPNAVGDKGASIGLLQNHMRGGRGTGYTKAQLLDPEFNVRLGMAEISKWYRQGEALGLSGPDLARYVGKHAQRPAAGMEEGYAKAYSKVGGLSGSGPLPVQGMPQLQSATQQVAPSVNALRAADQAGFARMAMAQTLTNTLLTNVVMHLVRIAANTAKPIIVQGGSASGGGRSAVQQSGMAGQGNQGTSGNPGRYLS
jgi:TP901 family phage tail tape measure protein